MQMILYVGLGGFLGTVARYLCELGLRSLGYAGYAVMFVNLFGSFLIGLLVGYGRFTPNAYLVLATGVLGGFTTYSAFSLQVVQAMREGRGGLWIALGTLLVCGMSTYLGLILGRAIDTGFAA